MKRKASRAWKRPLAGLLTLAMVVCLLSSAPLSASVSAADEETVSESTLDGQENLDEKKSENDESAPEETVDKLETETSSDSEEVSGGTDINDSGEDLDGAGDKDPVDDKDRTEDDIDQTGSEAADGTEQTQNNEDAGDAENPEKETTESGISPQNEEDSALPDEENALETDSQVLYVKENASGEADGSEEMPYATIQAAIDVIAEKGDSAEVTYTIQVAEGTYSRFFVPADVQNVVISGVGDSTVVNVADGSSAPAAFKGQGTDTCGIIVYGGNITIQNMKIEAGSGTENDTWARSAIGTVLANAGLTEGYKLTVKDCTFVGQGETTACYGVLMANDLFEISGCSFDGFSSAIEMMGDNRVTKDCSIINNTITDCNYAIHGYYGVPKWGNTMDTSEVKPVVITGNTICGDGDASDNTSAYTVVTLTDNLNSGALKIDMHDNTFSYAIVGGLALEGDVSQGSLENLLTTNNFTDNSFVVDARLTLDENGVPTGYYDTNYYAPKQADKIATWYADPYMDANAAVDKGQLIEDLVSALKQYGSAGQVLVTNPEDAFDYSLAKNALVIKEYVDAGDLKITKKVTNQNADDTEFTFTIHFTTAEGVNLKGRYDYRIDGGETQTVMLENGNMTVSLKAGQSVVIEDMLPGTQYTVTERFNPSYTVVGNGASGAITANETQEVVITNELKDETTPGDSVDVDKTATDLDSQEQTTVTLKIGAGESKDKVAVLFLLDKSTSQKMRDEAARMLQELKGKTNTDIIYDVVIFHGSADATGWQSIQDDAVYENIQEQFVNPEKVESGTNMDAGIERAMIEAGNLPKEYADAETYLITLSDGVTYVWNENDTKMTVPVIQQRGPEDAAAGEISIDKDVTAWDMVQGKGVSFTDLYGSFEEFLANAPVKMEASREAGYVRVYDGNYTVTTTGLLTTYIYDETAKQEVAKTYGCGPEFSAYESAEGYAELVKFFDKSFAYPVPEYDENTQGDKTSTWDEYYPWGKELMLYCQSLSTNKGDGVIANTDAEKIFEEIADEILYAMKKGTVTDVIGSNFDLTDIGNFALTVGGAPVSSIRDDETNTINFGTEVDGVYPYTVTYYPNGNGTETREHFVWTINVPVESGQPLELTYTLKLINKASAEGSYTVQTNEEAVLEYEPTTGDPGTATFPKPEVTYAVSGSGTPIPPGGSGGSGSGSGSSGHSSSPTQTTSAQTGDETNILLPAVTLIIAAAVLGTAGMMYYRKRRS